MRKKIVIAAVALALAFGGYGGWYWWTALRFLESTDDAYVASDVSVISPKVEGYIKAVAIRENQAVKKGAVLFVIDDSDFAAKVAQGQAAVATEEAALATFASRLDLQQAMIAQAQATVQSADADLTRTQQDFKRYSALMTTDFASRQRYEQAQADARKAEAEAAKSRAALAAAQSQLGVLRSQQQEEQARLQQARANLKLAQNDLDNTVIRAPISGVAGNRAGQVGQYVKPGTELLSVVPLPRVYVTANFKETQLTQMRPGQRAEVSVDAYPDHPLAGRIDSFAPASGAEFSLLPPDNATGNFTKIVQRVPVRIALPREGPLARLLRPGLSVTVTVDTRDQGETIAGDGIVGTAEAKPAAAGPGPSAMTWAPAALRRVGWATPPSGCARAHSAGKTSAGRRAAIPSRAPAQSARLVRRAGDVGWPVHGDHGRPDRDQLAHSDPGRAVGQRRRDQLGANRLSDRRRRDGAAERDLVAAVVDAGAVRHRDARLHRGERALRDSDQPQPDDHLTARYRDSAAARSPRAFFQSSIPGSAGLR